MKELLQEDITVQTSSDRCVDARTFSVIASPEFFAMIANNYPDGIKTFIRFGDKVFEQK